jgi:4-amino-4-deoxy-L-arabinose transferase-like glycosyltransferase
VSRRQTFILLAILLIGAALRFRLAQDQCLHKWDERFHALVAKNVVKHPLKPTLYDDPVLPYDYKQWYSNHVWVHKPPLPLWIIAASYKLFETTEFYTRLPSVLFSILVILVTFLLGRELFTVNVALLGAFFMAVNGFVIEMASGRISTDHYDSQFLAFILFSIYFSFRSAQTLKWWFAMLCGLFLGCALLTKWAPALIVLPVYFLFMVSFRRSAGQTALWLSLSLITATCVALPWQLYARQHYPVEFAWEQHYNFLHFVKELEGHYDREGWMYYLNRLRINYSEIIYLPLGFLLYSAFKQKTNYRKWALVAWIFIPLIIFSCARTKLQGYILFTSPALFLIIADFFYFVKEQIPGKEKKVKVFYRFLLVVIIFIPIRYCFERTQFGFSPPRHKAVMDNYKKITTPLTEKSVVLNVGEPVEFMFYNDCIAYSTPAVDAQKMTELKGKGYRFFTYDPSTNEVTENL